MTEDACEASTLSRPEPSEDHQFPGAPDGPHRRRGGHDPQAPTCTNPARDGLPQMGQIWRAVSTGERLETHTALTAMKKESSQERPRSPGQL